MGGGKLLSAPPQSLSHRTQVPDGTSRALVFSANLQLYLCNSAEETQTVS